MTKSPTATLFAGLVIFFAAAGCLAAAWQGPALDEFWSLHVGDPAVPLPELFRERWLRDPHPPLANLLYRLAAIAGAQDVAHMRLMLNVPFLAFLACSTMLTASAARSHKAFYYVFAAFVLALPQTLQHFTNYRIYFVQIVILTVAIQYLFYCLSDSGGARRSKRVVLVHVLGTFSIVTAFWLHFVTALLFVPLAGLATCVLAATRRRAAARRIGASAGLAFALIAVFGVVQALTLADNLDVRWIQTSTRQALRIMVETVAKGALAAPVAIALLLLLAARADWRTCLNAGAVKGALAKPQVLLVVMLGISILLGAAVLLVLNARQPIVIDRYLIGWQVMAAAAVAALASEPLSKRPVWIIAQALWAASLVGFISSQHMRNERWSGPLQKAAAIARTCPTARILATSNWRFTSFRSSRTAERESYVSNLGYRLLAGKAGVAVNVLDHRTPIVLRPDTRCPTMLWVSHVAMLNRPFSSPLEALSRGNIVLDRPAKMAFAPGIYGNNMLLIIGPEQR